MATVRTRWSAATHLAVGAAFFAATVLVATAGIVVITTEVDAKSFWENVVITLLTVAGGVIITGAVGIAVNRLREHEAAARDNAAFVETQVIKLWDIHENVKRSAVLVASHQSAKTYGEELRAIIRIRTSLSDVEGVVERRRHELPELDFEAFSYQIDTALFFLNPLIDEFREGYKDVSARQSVDEANNKRTFNTGDWENQSRQAWTALCDTAEFPQLHKLIAFGRLTADQYRHDSQDWARAALTLEFLDPIDLAAQLLRAKGSPARSRVQERIDGHKQRRHQHELESKGASDDGPAR